jgi:DNA-binding NarL/FixJ family response regulator
MLEGAPDVEVVGEASDGVKAVELAASLDPDVVLMDLKMPGTDGVTATLRIRERRSETRVLILTSFESDEDVERALRGGATGYLLKDAPSDELLRAVRLAARGDAALAPEITGRLIRQLTALRRGELNARELQILELVARGKSNKEIADELWVSVETVKSQLEAVRDKLGATDRTNAVFIAASRGLIRPPAP